MHFPSIAPSRIAFMGQFSSQSLQRLHPDRRVIFMPSLLRSDGKKSENGFFKRFEIFASFGVRIRSATNENGKSVFGSDSDKTLCPVGIAAAAITVPKTHFDASHKTFPEEMPP